MNQILIYGSKKRKIRSKDKARKFPLTFLFIWVYSIYLKGLIIDLFI